MSFRVFGFERHLFLRLLTGQGTVDFWSLFGWSGRNVQAKKDGCKEKDQQSSRIASMCYPKNYLADLLSEITHPDRAADARG